MEVHLTWGGSSKWSYGTNSACGSNETTTERTHPTLFLKNNKNYTHGSGHELGPVDALICPCLAAILFPFLFDVFFPKSNIKILALAPATRYD